MFQGYQHAWFGCIALTISTWAGPAAAFCRTSTCATYPTPDECKGGLHVRDPATGCVMRGKPIYWAQRCVSFSVQAGGSARLGLDSSQVESIVAEAFGLWPAAACNGGSPSIALYSTAPISCDLREYNDVGPNANAVLFRENEWDYEASAIAVTTVRFDLGSGEIRGADMEINTYDYELLTPQNLSYVVAHEAGHFLGLDHSARLDAVMFAEYQVDSPVNARRAAKLSNDDIAGICAIYPPQRDTPPSCDPEPETGFASDCGGDVVASCSFAKPSSARAPSWLFGGVASGLMLRRRKQRNRSRAIAGG